MALMKWGNGITCQLYCAVSLLAAQTHSLAHLLTYLLQLLLSFTSKLFITPPHSDLIQRVKSPNESHEAIALLRYRFPGLYVFLLNIITQRKVLNY
jgi:hypothetical protein